MTRSHVNAPWSIPLIRNKAPLPKSRRPPCLLPQRSSTRKFLCSLSSSLRKWVQCRRLRKLEVTQLSVKNWSIRWSPRCTLHHLPYSPTFLSLLKATIANQGSLDPSLKSKTSPKAVCKVLRKISERSRLVQFGSQKFWRMRTGCLLARLSTKK